MSDSRDRFQDLRAIAGEGFESTPLRLDLDPIQTRVARYRTGRMVLASVVGLVMVGAVVFGTTLRPGPTQNAPLATPSSTPDVTVTPDTVVTQASDANPACNAATGIEGKPAGSVGGMEGWWNSTPVAACDQWDQQILDHPDTVTINTYDDTMVEAYYRTSIDALGVYANLGPDFVIPDPDPSWPADSMIVIDARTGEVLASSLLFGERAATDADASDTVDVALLLSPYSLIGHADGGIVEARIPTGFHLASITDDPGGMMPMQTYLADDGMVVTIRLVEVPWTGRDGSVHDGWKDLAEPTSFVQGEATYENTAGDTLMLDIPIQDSADLIITGEHITDPALLRTFVWKLLT
ncbi:hypothetical protein [Demequina capsici]|uniref:Uncharacterized protein n=1 Tax=Demequina capsici TaxID=3075620 RepID=A0AA96F9C6_9MICO|nr:hypothetical protein [Demequina sp. OYTSA14]WNM24431.1 hypothetical protein RN606_13865 [Demequina sp. OYTSA14]